MQQMWLMNQRIDSIPLLRALFAGTTGEALEDLCVEFRICAEKGVLTRWLGRQPETINISEIRDIWKNKENIHEKPEALALLCGIGAEVFFTDTFRRKLDTLHDTYQERLKKLRSQDWWNDRSQSQKILKLQETDFRMVITDNTMLQCMLDTLHDSCTGNRVLYLCNAGEPYMLNLRGVQNTTILGVGEPQVYHVRLTPDEIINASVRGLILKDFTLYCIEKECVGNLPDADNNFSQTILGQAGGR